MTTLKLNLKALRTNEPSKESVDTVKESDSHITNIQKTQPETQAPIASELWEKSWDQVDVAKDTVLEDTVKKSWIFSFSLPKNKAKIERDKLKAIQKSQEEKQSAEEEANIKNAPPKEDIQFQNYESSFSKEGNHIIKKIRNFRYTPKTRVWFILWLIVLTSGTLWLLMLMFPEKHSLEVYKASLIDIYNSNKSSVISTPSREVHLNPEDRETIPSQKSDLPQEKIQTQKERLRQHFIEKNSQ